MKLVFAVDAIFPPLTGIGRYALELATRLRHEPEIEDVRFFSLGRWVDDLNGLLAGDARAGQAAGASPSARHVAVALRKRLARQVWAVHAYSALAPRWMQYRLRTCRDRLYHSPNFFVPPFDGVSIATVHDLSIYKHPESHPESRRRLFDLEMARTLKRVSHLITGSEATRDEVVDYFGWPRDRISAIPLGVAPLFRPRAAEETGAVLTRYGLATGGYALCVSTIEPRKKIQQLLAAYADLPHGLRHRYPLVFAGASGWLDADIRARMEVGRQAGWVRCLGFVPGDDLPFLYAGARAFCYPSVYEGFGLPVLEAMASGVPVLTSNRSSLPEVSGGAAWLVDPDDHDALRDGIATLLEDEAWRAGAMARGIEVAAGKTWEACVRGTVATYKAVLGR